MTSTALVHRATIAERDELVHTLDAAFAADPVLAWLMPDPERRGVLGTEFFRISVDYCLPFGEVYRGGPAGAVWLPRGIGLDEETEKRFLGLGEETVDRWDACFSAMDAVHPREPHAYLFLLGAEPVHQGRGLGSALLRHVTDRLDREGTPAYLEATCADNRRLYLRHGFVDCAEILLPDGPPMFPMWREAQPAG